ncbi:MAG TPA: cytochrome c-type biogenesis protein CcmH [Acidobacteriaceae bacterium]|nr:cytochrome c-type biogenesis protein CcmH [Acidobacteriaceae bacterium]
MISRRNLMRTAQGLLFSLLAIAGLGASDAAARYDKDSHAMMCVCGCNELLGECNHVGCTDSDAMRTHLMASIAKGESDNAIFHEFQDQYGPVVLAAPMFTRFNHVAWVMPPLVLFLGIAGTLVLGRKWKFRGAAHPSAIPAPDHDALRDRIRRETQL